MFRVRKSFLITLVGIFLTIFSSVLIAQNLEIHYINVQQGGCTLIVGPNGTTLLYDGGVEGKGTTEIIPYLQGLGITSGQKLNYVMVSHRDTDHYGGLTDVLNGGYDALRVYDNGSDKTNTYFQAFENAVAGTTAGAITPVTLGQVIDLGNGARATVVAANGSVYGVGPIPNGTDNENDRTVCLLIEYGDFDYLLSGDVGGGSADSACTGRSTSQINIESPLVTALMPGGAHPMLSAYGVEVVHVPHHGSESSNNSDYMNLLSPRVGCISVGDGQSPDWFHPRKDVVENVLMGQGSCITVPPALVLQTEEGNPVGVNTSYAGYCVGDIVITTDGVNSYTIRGSGAVSQGPDERATAGLPATFYFDEYSGGDLPPQLYSIHTDAVTQTSASILWTTNEVATSMVNYGITSGSYTGTVNDSTLTVNHSLSLTSLSPATKYYYIVKSTDSTGNTTTSMEYNFTTGGAAPVKVVFSEIYYDTIGNDAVEEWIELYNNSPAIVNIGGWTITDNNGLGGTYTIPTGTTIKPGSYLTIANNSAGFNALYGFDADVYGLFPGLNNTGDALIMKNSVGVVVDAVGWEGGAAGGVPTSWGSTTAPNAPIGSSILRNDVTLDSNTYSDWGVAPNNGNPQTQTSTVAVPKVVFSEIFYDTLGDETKEEWLELYNNSTKIVDLSGWKIIDNNGTAFTYTFPAGSSIKPATYLTVGRDSATFVGLYGYEADIYGNLPFLNNSGEALILYDAANQEVDAVAFEGGASAGMPAGWGSTTSPWASAGNTIVRIDPTVDTNTYVDWSYATNGGNPGVQTVPGNILFSEIFYDTPGDETKEEWIELYNNSTFKVNIGGWKITDNNGAGVTYTIPAGTSMEPGTFLTISTNSAAFVALYGYEADVYGSFPPLNNSGESLILYDTNKDVKDFVAWEGGASAGIPAGWGSTSSPWAAEGNSIVRVDYKVDTNTYLDWTFATNLGHPQTQIMGVPDTTPPTISDVLVSTITINSAIVTWNTNENADAVLEYGIESGNYVSTLNNTTLETAHSFALTGLSHNTMYYFHVTSTDEAGNTTTSPEFTFKTLDIMTNTLTLVDYKHTNDVYGKATFTVTDSSGMPVVGATLNVTWSGGYITGTVQGDTDENGQITFMSDRVHPNKWTFIITLNSIVKEGFYWDAANSVVTARITKHPQKD